MATGVATIASLRFGSVLPVEDDSGEQNRFCLWGRIRIHLAPSWQYFQLHIQDFRVLFPIVTFVDGRL